MYFPQICSLNLYEVLPVFRTLFVCYTSDNKCISAFLFFIRTFSIGSGHLKFFLLGFTLILIERSLCMKQSHSILFYFAEAGRI